MIPDTDTTESAEVGDRLSFAHHLRPVRGILSTHNAAGRAFDLTALEKWISLGALFFKAMKMDVRLHPEAAPLMSELLSHADRKQMRLSLRTTGDADVRDLPEWKRRGLMDVLLVLRCPDAACLEQWMGACADASLPLRVQLCAPFSASIRVSEWADRLAKAAAVHIALFDYFDWNPAIPSDNPGAELENINGLAAELRNRSVEVNLLHVPHQYLQQENLPHRIDHDGFYQDHQLYIRRSYEFAIKIHQVGPARMEKAVENLLGRRTSIHNAIDNALLPWLLEHSRLYGRVWMLHKLTRHIPYVRRYFRPLSGTEQFALDNIQIVRLRTRSSGGPVEVKCRRPRTADHELENFKRLFPGVAPRTTQAESAKISSASDVKRTRYYDDIDNARRGLPERLAALAGEARRVLWHEPPTREISADDYDVEGRYGEHMPGALRWHAYVNIELNSTELPAIVPPFTLSIVFGGGMAGQVGFSFGRHARIVCPMIEYSHEITLHADADGHFALLRDGVLAPPTEFEGISNVPPKLAGRVVPRICIHNLDGLILTQGLRVWEHGKSRAIPVSFVKYSVVVINTRFSRRLQAMLLSLAHQKDFDLSKLEVAVGYVPGIDTTDDVIDGLQLICPSLRVVRSPFSEHYAKSKGFMINETVPITSGSWLIFLDADIVIPPDFFAKIETVEQRTHFIAPEGRRMLSPAVTARILLGLERPWENFEALATQAAEYRQAESGGIPIGFCQCVRREHFQRIPYCELDHFESSDYIFGLSMVNTFGKEVRLEGTDVLHLDHGGSQWYGTKKQM